MMVKRRVDNFFSVTNEVLEKATFPMQRIFSFRVFPSYNNNNNNGELLLHYKEEEEQGPDQFK